MLVNSGFFFERGQNIWHSYRQAGAKLITGSAVTPNTMTPDLSYKDVSGRSSQGQPTTAFGMASPKKDTTTCAIEGGTQETTTNPEEQWQEDYRVWFTTLPWYYRPSRSLLCVILALHTLSFTILMGPLMVLMLENICPSSEAPDCTAEGGQHTLSNVQTILSAISGLLGFCVSGILGQWSDCYGRVFVFKLISIINVAYIIGLFLYFEWFGRFSELLMVLMLSVGFLNGGIMTLIATGNSYLNDIVTAEERTVAISRLMAVIYTMLGIGPLFGSFVIKLADRDSAVVLNWSLGFALTTMILIFGFLTETRHPEAMERARVIYAEESKVNTDKAHERLREAVKAFIHPMKRVWLPPSTTGSLLPRRNVFCLVLIDLLVMCSTVGTMHTVIMYTMLEYTWSSVEIGYYMSLTGFGKTFVLLIIAPCLISVTRDKMNWTIDANALDNIDKWMITLSSVLVVSSCLTISLWKSAKGVYASAVLQSLAGLMSPTIQSSVIKYSSKATVGEMFGAIALLRHLAMLVAPVFFLQVYTLTLNVWPDCFLYIALACACSTFVLSKWGLKVGQTTNDEER